MNRTLTFDSPRAWGCEDTKGTPNPFEEQRCEVNVTSRFRMAPGHSTTNAGRFCWTPPTSSTPTRRLRSEASSFSSRVQTIRL